MREFFKRKGIVFPLRFFNKIFKKHKNLFSPQRNAFFVVYISEGALREEGEVL